LEVPSFFPFRSFVDVSKVKVLPKRHAHHQCPKYTWSEYTRGDLRRSLKSSKTFTSRQTARWPARIVVSASVPISRILLVCITFSIIPHFFRHRVRSRPSLVFGGSVILFFIVVIVAQDVLLHRCCRAFDRCERALEAALFEASPTLPTSASSNCIRVTCGCINDLQPGLRISLALSATGLLCSIWVARELFKVLKTFPVLVVV